MGRRRPHVPAVAVLLSPVLVLPPPLSNPDEINLPQASLSRDAPPFDSPVAGLLPIPFVAHDEHAPMRCSPIQSVSTGSRLWDPAVESPGHITLLNVWCGAARTSCSSASITCTQPH
ncbi:hypothetical protein ZWY2020_004622 [Hordeum vulgare]|nr:hypothetical protein ZWY2020_004622 [Hordeum vulgare]